MSELDPVTFEVLRHRLWMINQEQGKIAVQISGSPIVYASNDFACSLLTPEGDSLFVGAHVTLIANSLHIIAKNVIRLFQESEGIHEGDMFVTNDPWMGAGHHNDFAVIAPVFWEGEIVCWTGIAMHEMDVGGPTPGLSFRGRNAFEEPPLVPPLKLVERGQLRRDIERLLLRNTRTPEMNGLDLRARIAAQNVAREQIHEIVREYGKDTFLEVQLRIKRLVTEAIRRRLRELPDGVWQEEGFIDHSGTENRLFRLALKMTKRGERLIFDFRGTDKQVEGAVNCAPPGLWGGIFSALLPVMCYDLPWCPAGLYEVLEVISEEGTLNNAEFPAPVAMATLSAMWATGNLVRSCLAKMFACSELYRNEVQANWAPGLHGLRVRGYHRDNPARLIIQSGFGAEGGGGARSWCDGLDSAGVPGAPGISIPNVETVEEDGLVLVLYRRQNPETAALGKFRGGCAVEVALMPYDNAGTLELSQCSQGYHHPEGKGLYGGFPSNVQASLVLQGARGRELLRRGFLPSSLEEIPRVGVEVLEAKCIAVLTSDDMVVAIPAGGAGYGDPLERDPELVRADVERLLCSDPLRYGVVLKQNRVDPAATKARRDFLREERLRRGRPVTSVVLDQGIGGTPLFDVGECFRLLTLKERAHFSCIRCGHLYGPINQDPKKSSLVFDMATEELTPLNRYASNGKDMVARGFCCPGCGLLIGVQVREKEQPCLFDMEMN